MLALRPPVPSRWDWFRLSFSTPHLRAGLSYAVPAGLEYRGVLSGLSRVLFVALYGTAKAVPFPSKVKGRVKIRVKGDGQECPSHTCH
jgi:hypothetical protein